MNDSQVLVNLHFHVTGDDMAALEQAVNDRCNAFYGGTPWTATATAHPTKMGKDAYYDATVEAFPRPFIAPRDGC